MANCLPVTSQAPGTLLLRFGAWCCISLIPLAALGDEGADFFTEKIQPILKERCYECHSHASGKTKGGLTLDSRSGWIEGGNSGPAIVPNRPAESLLVKAVRREDADSAMPPKKPMPHSEVKLIEEWVSKGAPDPRVASVAAKPDTNWWSLKPIPTVREVRERLGTAPTIDAFITRKLSENGLAPAREADRVTLIRRLYFDLNGLSPTPEEVAAFIADSDPGAYEKLVDRLLASPRYGERWARHWLDTIHFADTHGFEHDEIRSDAWRFRDYVIDALNRDTPWPRFIREQLAADVFFPNEPTLTAALGFLGAGPFDASAAGTAPKMFEAVDRDDMLVQTMSSFASVTAGCARCHDHKFDPISQQDYYSLAAVFAGVTKGDILYDADPAVKSARERWQRLAAAAERRDCAILLGAEAQEIASEWESRAGSAKSWEVAALSEYKSSGGATLTPQPDGALISEGQRPDKEALTLRFRPKITAITGVRLEVLSDPALPKGGPGRQDNGNLHLSECEIYIDGPGGARQIKIARATADFNQQDWTIQHAIDGNEKTAWGIYPRVGESHTAVFAFARPQSIEPGASLRVVLKQLHGAGHVIGKLRLAVTEAPSPESGAAPSAVVAALAVPPTARSENDRLSIAAHAVQARSSAELAKFPPQARVYAAAPAVMRKDAKVAMTEPRLIHVLARGELDKPVEVANPGALACIGNLPARFDLRNPKAEATRRAALADWLANEGNPLTWRSIVNRVWHYHFGRGLVDTPNDLGRMGSLPSHPELLDWLATEFRDSGGSLKNLHRLILTSAAYRQASTGHAAAAKIDGDNRLLWRANRQRIDAESFRDIVMQKSGKLDLTMGGPAVMHFKLGPPVQSTPTLDYTAFGWEKQGVNRRSIYRLVYRNIADPFMVAMDFPDAAQLAPVRPFSASALQALALWNDDFVLYHSEQLAARVESSAPTTAERVQAIVRQLFYREPTPGEARDFSAHAEKHGLAALCRVLFNSNEFLFVN